MIRLFVNRVQAVTGLNPLAPTRLSTVGENTLREGDHPVFPQKKRVVADGPRIRKYGCGSGNFRTSSGIPVPGAPF